MVKKNLILVLLLLVGVMFLTGGVAASCPEGMKGKGTEESPCEITRWAQLNAVRNNLAASYILMNNLDENSAGYETYASPTANEGYGWLPIGTHANRFTGNFDGQRNTISDLFINRSGTEYIGLFGLFGYIGYHYDIKSEISNLGLENVNITGDEGVGGLAGSNWGTITNSYSTGSVSGEYGVGGLTGLNEGTITNSYSTGNVRGINSVGGLVRGINSVGGLVGWNYEGTIANSYSTGSVSGNSEIGGLVGINDAEITNSYWYNSTENSKLSCSYRYEDEGCTAISDLNYFYNYNNAPMNKWDFKTIWSNAYDGTDYPIFQWQEKEKSLFNWVFWLMLLLILVIIAWVVWYLKRHRVK